MIKVRIQIGEGEVVDTFDEYGLCYLSSDDRLDCGIKGFESVSYPEEEGEHTDGKTVAGAFDYKVNFLVQAKNADLTNANAIIQKFNESLYDQSDSIDSPDIRKYKKVTFYNDYKRVKIVGLPNPITTATEFWRDKYGQVADAVQVEFTIRVTKPSLCDFNLSNGDE